MVLANLYSYLYFCNADVNGSRGINSSHQFGLYFFPQNTENFMYFLAILVLSYIIYFISRNNAEKNSYKGYVFLAILAGIAAFSLLIFIIQCPHGSGGLSSPYAFCGLIPSAISRFSICFLIFYALFYTIGQVIRWSVIISVFMIIAEIMSIYLLLVSYV